MALLDHIHSSADVNRLRRDELPQLAAELRAEIIDVCAVTGGHLASSLGAVELTVALHHVHDSARDRIVWDVGHQTYGHKILTGRRERMRSIRTNGGLAGFTTSSESADDALTVGHASTSLAAALGMALARDARGAPYDVIAVIGDGALTGGMALAALNQIGHQATRMTIVLNDNEMSISENVGALNGTMRRLQVQPWFQRAESRGKAALEDLWAPLAEIGSRANKAALMERYYGRDDYLNAMLEDAESFLAPYAKHVWIMLHGNHDADMVKYHETDLVRLLAVSLNRSGASIATPGYQTHIAIKPRISTSKYGELVIGYITHGSGGSAPQTGGVLNASRRAAWVPQADFFVSGHLHRPFDFSTGQVRVSQSGRVFKQWVDHVQVGAWKDESSSAASWANMKGMPPSPVGPAYWLELRQARGEKAWPKWRVKFVKVDS